MSDRLQERARGLNGAATGFIGPSGCGKSYQATATAIASAMLIGGMCLAYDPSGDISQYVTGYRNGAVEALNRARESDAPVSRTRILARRLDFLRTNVRVYRGRDAHRIFDVISGVIGDGKPHTEFYGSVLIDETALAREEIGFIESMAPLFRNAGIKGYYTSHRWMGGPPKLRAITRYRVVWQGADYTGDSELEHLSRDESFQFSPVMSGLDPSEQTYHGVYYGPNGPEHRSFNPCTHVRPDWLLLPAPLALAKPMVLR